MVLELELQGVKVQRRLAAILVEEEEHYYSHEHTVYNRSFEAEPVEWLAVVKHTGVVQTGIAVVLSEHL